MGQIIYTFHDACSDIDSLLWIQEPLNHIWKISESLYYHCQLGMPVKTPSHELGFLDISAVRNWEINQMFYSLCEISVWRSLMLKLQASKGRIRYVCSELCATHTVETQHVSTKQDEIFDLLKTQFPNYTQWSNDFLPRDAVCAAF